ncbi:MAG: hypothetical protein SFV17_06080 [Candidatus Obscuribacter sp.]|nr:hypothetical protein [Candidatus Melainabacteria bacterium]MBK8224954.1 hypothetical protein [Candidatus Obscuribacter sp.]MDX1986235.1 hypothetical protein [Candidatus Obscuribacter sp.]HMW93122.1 hypothetical protein [Candidatus Obscuribacter sp.]HNH75896.1 hypothetical protein [Candidatus Obscuribacter sp.]
MTMAYTWVDTLQFKILIPQSEANHAEKPPSPIGRKLIARLDKSFSTILEAGAKPAAQAGTLRQLEASIIDCTELKEGEYKLWKHGRYYIFFICGKCGGSVSLSEGCQHCHTAYGALENCEELASEHLCDHRLPLPAPVARFVKANKLWQFQQDPEEARASTLAAQEPVKGKPKLNKTK